jgi:hypothetical protein
VPAASVIIRARDEALLGLLDGPSTLAFELGRRLPNRAPQRARLL